VDENWHFTHLFVLDIADTDADPSQLTDGDFTVTGFDWAPDGTSLVFSHKATPAINDNDTDLSIVSVEGTIRSLVSRPGSDDGPIYSPDGGSIAFTSDGGRPEPIGLSDVWVVATAGGQPHKLGETPDRNTRLLGWSGDGSSVYLTEAVHTSRHLIELPVDGRNPTILTRDVGVFGSFAFDADASRVAFTYQNTHTPADVYVANVGRMDLRRVTNVHADVPRPRQGRTELLTWESFDGRRIEGLLTYPVDYEEGRRYPLMLNVHGGPGGVYTQAFTGNPSIYMIQYFAQEGYAVLRPNPRGSAGYGKEFRYANVQDWGYGDYEDLMSGVDHVIDMGVAHADSLLLMGWSYGGYMTSFAVTRTDRFKAASMGAGLPNLISMVMTTDIPDYLAGHMGGEFWDDYETYEKHSAMYRIANVTTPTQVIHGENDDRVPLRQGQEFYVALKRRGIPTEMIILPRTPHGPREPKLLMGVSEHILKWFETHLGKAKPKAVTED
jgi:dipeptidyl aminopeptidase/acylaminoacyl peptidase